jgi:pimeloyl-ACP methyl ester carboxylesterase
MSVQALHPQARRAAYAAVALTLALSACSSADPSPAARADEAPSPSASATATSSPTESKTPAIDEPVSVDIGGRTLQLSCTGTGKPTVILEAGMAGDLRTWGAVQPKLAADSRVCSYDRAGVGGSPPAPSAPEPRTAAAAVDDLHTLLGVAEIEPPYVLVGFSFGGVVTQLYAATYPKETAGIVLVESNHAREQAVFEKHLTPKQIKEDKAFVLGNPEGMDPFLSFEEISAAGPLPDVPLTVVTAGLAEGWPPGWDPETFDRLRAELQKDLTTLVPGGGKQVIAKDSHHSVPQEAPLVVVDAVAEVRDQVRKG